MPAARNGSRPAPGRIGGLAANWGMTWFVVLSGLVCGRMAAHLPGAQTGRRGGAGPAGGLLGGKDPAGRFLIRDGRTYHPFYFFSFTSNSSAASARKRRSSSFFEKFLSIHRTARSY